MNDEVFCGKYVCTEDIISYDDIKEEENCVAIDNYNCVSCDTVHKVKNTSPQEFYKNPSKLLFNQDLSEEKIQELWNDLNKNCGLEFLVLAKENINFISPDVKTAERNYLYLQKVFNSKYIPKLNAIIEIIRLSPQITEDIIYIETKKEKDIYQTRLKNQMMFFLQRSGWNCLLIHHPLEIPYIFALILQKLVDDPSKIEFFIDFVDSNPQACVEAEFDQLYRKIYS